MVVIQFNEPLVFYPYTQSKTELWNRDLRTENIIEVGFIVRLRFFPIEVILVAIGEMDGTLGIGFFIPAPLEIEAVTD